MIKRIAAERWGIKRHVVNALYGAVVLPIVKYGAMLWCDAVTKVMVKRCIMALQRAMLLIITKACRTTSTAAMQVIAGAEPLDLDIIEDVLVRRVKRNLNTTWEEYTYTEKEMDLFQETLSTEIERIRVYILDKWQRRWQEECHSRETYNFIPKMTFALRNKKWFVPNRFVTYLITGYGPINGTLYKRGISDRRDCPICGEEEETVDHIIFNCVGYQDERWNGMVEFRRDKKELIRNEQMIIKFNNFAYSVFEQRCEAT